MKTKKKILSRLGLTMIVFCAIFAATTAIKAAAVTGWIWGGSQDGNATGLGEMYTGLGWFSMSSKNCDTDGDGYNEVCDVNNDNVVNASDTTDSSATTIAPYGVEIPWEDGILSGKAWSSNVGFITFDAASLGGCPAGNGACTARRVGNNIEGWARIVSIAANPGNAGGWEGWIKLNGVAGGSPYGVKISGLNLSGYALSGSSTGVPELGWISFTGAVMPTPPTVTLTANPTSIDMDANPNWASGAGTAIKLTWTMTGGTANCVKSSVNGSWSGNTNSGGNETVNQTSPNVTYRLTCDSGVGVVDAVVLTGCRKKSCSGTTCAPVWDAAANGMLNNSKCVQDSTCSTDADCQAVAPSGWTEVAP